MNDLTAKFITPIEEIIDELLHGETPLNTRFLHRLSDLVDEEFLLIKKAWPNILAWRRQALLEDLEALYAKDTLLSFEGVCRIALEDSNPQVRFLALRSFLEYEVADLIPNFIQTMIEDKDEEIRALAAQNLGKYVYLGEVESLAKEKQENIEAHLLKVAHGSDSSLVRRKAIESLGYSSHKDVPDLISEAYNSNRNDWIASALFAMGRTIDPRWEPEIIKMLRNPVKEIRFEAIKAAGELEISSSRKILMEYLEDPDSEIRIAAIWALARIGGEGIRTILLDILQETEFEEEALIIEEALDHLIFNQSLGSIDNLEFFEVDEF